MKKAVLITGCHGGIGQALVKAFSDAGWFVVGTDCAEGGAVQSDVFIKSDIAALCLDENARVDFADQVRQALGSVPLAALVNNAAVQILGKTTELKTSDMVASMNVNVIAPFALVKMFAAELENNAGAVVNIGSVHAQATKPEFAAYATSKAALHGLTRALAVDLGPAVRVNTLAPAATWTAMLKAGFEKNPAALKELEDVHPAKRIATPEEIAKMVLFLASIESSFLTGATLYADGGILSRLHDPV